MSLASWFSASQLHRAPALNKPGSRTSRQPIHSRPVLEHLEERMLLDASSGFIGGASNNLNLNSNFNLASSGNVLPIPTNGSHAVLDSASGDAAATADLPAQDQPASQFRLFGINSQGDDFRLILKSATSILRDAYGFGSGVMPNAPWMPKVYSVGLANHQYGYPSQTDMGFSSVGPWSHRVAQSQPKDEKLYQIPSENQEEDAVQEPEQLAVQKSLREQEQPQQHKVDMDDGDTDKELKELLDPPASENQRPTEAVAQDDGSIPDSMWLSVFSPVPMAALVAGLPGMTAAAEGGDVGAETAD